MQCRAAWRPALTALAVAAAGAACDEPEVGPVGQAASNAPQIAIIAASVNGSDQVVATFTVARGGPVDAARECFPGHFPDDRLGEAFGP